MVLRPHTARADEAWSAATALLQRARLADPVGGTWAAGDVQWWSRKPRRSDTVDQVFWSDADGPVAGVLLTEWGGRWQCDLLRLQGAGPSLGVLWDRAADLLNTHASGAQVEMPVPAGSTEHAALASGAGLGIEFSDNTGWLDLADRPPVGGLPDGFVIVDRTDRADHPHPMSGRNGHGVADRLARCSLYDPYFDLAVEAPDSRAAGYVLCWPHPVTGVGLVEPVRVEDEFWRRGLATAMITEGLERAARAGLRRMKISWESDAAGTLYQSLGFVPAATTSWFSGVWQGET